jgi:hypothetical protein
MRAVPLLVALVACAPGTPAPQPRLYTVSRALALLGGGTSMTAGGMPLAALVAAPGAPIVTHELFDPTRRANEGGAVIPVHIAFADGAPAAYTITEVWEEFDEVWVQPLYVALRADGTEAAGNRVFGIDEKSRFYSPFWVVRFYTVPDNTEPGTFRRTKDVLDFVTRTGAKFTNGPGAICSIVPDATTVDSVRPLFGDAVAVSVGRVWVEGRQVSVVSFGFNRFRWDERQVVIEDPIFTFVDAAGAPLGIPNVAGSIGVPAPGGRPQSALWRVHTVRAPAGAKPFIPPGTEFDAARTKLGDPGEIHASVASRTDLKEYALRLATKPSCWSDASGFPGECGFLDSEEAIRAGVAGSAIARTGTLATCPLIFWKNAPVP